jgi:hypothetical protein
MATNKMKLRNAYRIGGDDYVEGVYGVRINKDDKNLHRQIDQVIVEHEETLKALAEEESKEEDNLEEKMEYLDTLDINQLRNMAKTTLGIPHKNLMKMKKEELIAELLK